MQTIQNPGMYAAPKLMTNRYRLICQIGVGGMGTVYEATNRLSGQRIALKQVNVALLALDEDLRDLGSGTDPQRAGNAQQHKV